MLLVSTRLTYRCIVMNRLRMGNLCGTTQQKHNSTNTNNNHGSVSDSQPVVSSATQHVKKLDPKDYILSRLSNETIVKQSGTISGQSYDIEYCSSCVILICDYTAQIQIDDCSDCVIYCGPCESSIFVRNCHNCRLITISQQLRLRDCSNIGMLIYVSATQPIIESCTDIQISGYDGNYFNLQKHFHITKLSLWNTEFSNVHDFTQNKNKLNWSYLPYNTKLIDFIPNISTIDEVDYINDRRQFVVPHTYGNRPKLYNQPYVIFIDVQYSDVVYKLLDKLYDTIQLNVVVLIRTREIKLSPQQYTILTNTKSTSIQSVIALEFDTKSLEFITNAIQHVNNNDKIIVPSDIIPAIDILFAPPSQI